MQASASPVLRDLVLVGGGHSHVGVLRMFAMAPEPGLRITLVCTDVDTPYSGMLPGYVAGHYAFDEVHIDLGRLAAFAGARMIRGTVTGIDRAERRVVLRDRPALPYDLVSINTGSTPDVLGVPGAEANVVPVKPIGRFDRRWRDLLERVRLHKSRYFASSWAHYETAVPGTLRLLPPESRLGELRRDYQAMEPMFLSTPLKFDEVLAILREAEQSLNAA